jgi:hypothetical protein
VLTRAQQDAVWDRVGLTNRIRGVLRRYFPAAIAAFERGGKHRLDSAACRVILRTAPTPSAAAKLSLARLQALLRRAGRTRGIDAEAVQQAPRQAVSLPSDQPAVRLRNGLPAPPLADGCLTIELVRCLQQSQGSS